MFTVDRIATYKHMDAARVTGFCALTGYNNRLNAPKSCSLCYKITVE